MEGKKRAESDEVPHVLTELQKAKVEEEEKGGWKVRLLEIAKEHASQGPLSLPLLAALDPEVRNIGYRIYHARALKSNGRPKKLNLRSLIEEAKSSVEGGAAYVDVLEQDGEPYPVVSEAMIARAVEPSDAAPEVASPEKSHGKRPPAQEEREKPRVQIIPAAAAAKDVARSVRTTPAGQPVKDSTRDAASHRTKSPQPRSPRGKSPRAKSPSRSRRARSRSPKPRSRSPDRRRRGASPFRGARSEGQRSRSRGGGSRSRGRGSPRGSRTEKPRPVKEEPDAALPAWKRTTPWPASTGARNESRYPKPGGGASASAPELVSRVSATMKSISVDGLEVAIVGRDIPVITMENKSTFSSNAAWMLQTASGESCKAEQVYDCLESGETFDRINRACQQAGLVDKYPAAVCVLKNKPDVIGVGTSGKRTMMMAMAIAICLRNQQVFQTTVRAIKANGDQGLADSFSRLITSLSSRIG